MQTESVRPQRKSNRLRGFNYSQCGYYFVTICLKKRTYSFGKIVKSKMRLNEIGIIAQNHWLAIPAHYPDVRMDEFIMMPDHLHGIIVIDRETDEPVTVGTEQCSVPTATTNKADGLHHNYGLLSKIIKSFKNEVTNAIKKSIGESEFAWQRSYYDHVIRDDQSLIHIREYIIQNPHNWRMKDAGQTLETSLKHHWNIKSKAKLNRGRSF